MYKIFIYLQANRTSESRACTESNVNKIFSWHKMTCFKQIILYNQWFPNCFLYTLISVPHSRKTSTVIKIRKNGSFLFFSLQFIVFKTNLQRNNSSDYK